MWISISTQSFTSHFKKRSEMLRKLLGGWIDFTGFLALDGKSVGWGRSRFETVSLDPVKMWSGVIKLAVTNVIIGYGAHGFKPRVNNDWGWTGWMFRLVVMFRPWLDLVGKPSARLSGSRHSVDRIQSLCTGLNFARWAKHARCRKPGLALSTKDRSSFWRTHVKSDGLQFKFRPC